MIVEQKNYYKIILSLILSILLLSSIAYALKFECTITAGIATCEIPHVKEIWDRVRSKIIMHGTEYTVQDNATVFLQLLEDGQPVDDGSCILDIFYPDKTQWLDNVAMYYLNNSDGLYYYDFVVPDKLGIYMLTSFCYWRIVEFQYNVSNFTLYNGSEFSGDYTDTFVDDAVYHIIDETLPRLEFEYVFTVPAYPYLVKELDFIWNGRWSDTDENVNIYIYNYNTSTWDLLPNAITYSATDMDVTNSVLDGDKYISNGTVRTLFSDTIKNDTVRVGRLRNDFFQLTVKCQCGESINWIRGGGEIHVSNLPEGVWEKFFIRGTPPLMKSTSYYCKDNTTLIANKTFEFCKDSSCKFYSKIEEIKCQWNCDEKRNECFADPVTRYAWVLALIIVILIAIALLRRYT